MSDSEVKWLQTQWEESKGAKVTVGTIVPLGAKKQQQPKRSCEVAAEWMKNYLMRRV